MSRRTKSADLTTQAWEVMPGPHSNLPGYENFTPMFFVRGQGARLWDVDGNEYIDYLAGVGAGILGWGHDEFVETVKRQVSNLYYLDGSRRIPEEIELAQKFIKHVPCAEKVRYVLSGSEAVQLAIRLARAATGRRLFIRFEGHYHGWLDNVLGGQVNDNPADKPYAIEPPGDPFGTGGRDPDAFNQSFKLPWNDIEVLESVFEDFKDEIALVIMEPILCNAGSCFPRPGYLERVRELCTEYGIVLCFDEIITGFRVALNGAQGLLSITPDLALFGKALAGGVPFAAVAGKSEIMDLLEDRTVVGGGTFNGYPLGVVAALQTLTILEKDDGAFYRQVDELQGQLMSGIRDISQAHNIPLLLQGPTGVFFCQFIDAEVAYSLRDWIDADHAKQESFRKALLEENVLIFFRGRWYVCGGLTEKDVNDTLESVSRVMSRM